MSIVIKEANGVGAVCMKLTREKIRKIILEAINWKNHVDGHPFPGTMEELADMHGKPWGGGEVVDPHEWSNNVSLAKKFTRGRAPSILKRKKVSEGTEELLVKIPKKRLRKIIRESISQYGNDDRVEHHPKRDELMDAIFNKYGLKSRTTEEFGTSPGGVWINAESNVPETGDGLPLFDYYLQADPYIFGIHPDFEAFVIDNYGFAPEWNDPGTLMLWSLD